MPLLFAASAAATINAAQLTLTNAQTLALPTVSASPPYGYVIVPAPGAGQALLFAGALLVKRGAPAYTNLGDSLIFAYENYGAFDLSPRCTQNSVLGNAFERAWPVPLTSFTVFGGAGGDHPVGKDSDLSTIENAGIILYGDPPAVGDFTGGSAGNTLTAIVNYSTITLPA